MNDLATAVRTPIRWGATLIDVTCEEPAVITYIANQHFCEFGTVPTEQKISLRVEVADPPTVPPTALFIGIRRSFADWTYLHYIDGRRHILLAGTGHEHHHVITTEDWIEWKMITRGPTAGVIACRIIRETVRQHVLHAGGQMFHGSAALVDEIGAGLIFLGHSGAGKTTIAALIGARGVGRTVATDRVMAHPTAGAWTITGLPTTTRLGYGALRFLTGVEPPRRESLARNAAAAASGDKWAFSNAEAKTSLGINFAAAAPLTAFVILDKADGDLELELLTQGEAATAMAPHVLAIDVAYPSMWLTPTGAVSPTGPMAPILAATLPCYRLRWAPERHGDSVLDVVRSLTVSE